MPLYGHECKDCGNEFDDFRKLENYNLKPPCPDCGSRDTLKVVGSAVQRVEPTWLPSACDVLLEDGNDVPPITDRNEFNRHLKRKGIEQK